MAELRILNELWGRPNRCQGAHVRRAWVEWNGRGSPRDPRFYGILMSIFSRYFFHWVPLHMQRGIFGPLVRRTTRGEIQPLGLGRYLASLFSCGAVRFFLKLSENWGVLVLIYESRELFELHFVCLLWKIEKKKCVGLIFYLIFLAL